MYYVYFRFSSKNSINIAVSPSPFIIGNYRLTALTPKHLHVCCSLFSLFPMCLHVENGVITLGLAINSCTWTSANCLPSFDLHVSNWKMAFEGKKERSAVYYRRFLTINNKRRRVNKAFTIFCCDFWHEVQEKRVWCFSPAGSWNFISLKLVQSYWCNTMCIHLVWEATADWQFP